MKNRLFTSLSVLLSLFCVSMSHSAEEVTGYETRIELTGKIGYSSKKTSKRNIGRLGFVVPMFQKLDSHLGYVTLIGMADSAKHVEGNFGVGYRSFINPAWILGEYVFYDLRSTENNNLLSQVTIGLEAFSKNLEFRINGYIPTKKKYELKNYNHYKASYNKHRNYTQYSVNNKKVIEQGVPGFDIEIGGSHRRLSRVELFAAYYYFNGKDLQSTIGGRLRSNIHLYHWLTTELEVNYDNNRGFVSYLGLRLGWTLGKNSAYKSWSQIKMTQLPVRDIDIISSEAESLKRLLGGKQKGKAAIYTPDFRDGIDEIEEIDGAILASTLEKGMQKAKLSGNQLDSFVRLSVNKSGDVAAESGLKDIELLNVEKLSKKQEFSKVIKKNSKLEVELLTQTNQREMKKFQEEQRRRKEAEDKLAKERNSREQAELKLKELKEELKDYNKQKEKLENITKKREEQELELDTVKNERQKLQDILKETQGSGDDEILLNKVLAASKTEEKLRREISFKDKDIKDREVKLSQSNARIKDLQRQVSTSKASKNLEKVNKSLEQQIQDLKEDKKRLEAKVPQWKVNEVKKKREREVKERKRKEKAREQAKKRQKQNNGGVNTGPNQQTAKQSLKARFEQMQKQNNTKQAPKRTPIVITRSKQQQEQLNKTKTALKTITQAQANKLKSKSQKKTTGPQTFANQEKFESPFSFEVAYHNARKQNDLDNPGFVQSFNGQISQYIGKVGLTTASQYKNSNDRKIKDKKMDDLYQAALKRYFYNASVDAGIDLGQSIKPQKKAPPKLAPGRANLMAMLRNRTKV
ncbi:MAG: hypothetical protein HRT87_03370 [Legionellales bacterium]|nr:hypothetical protein [Legionellales bacterium]